jgi:hypothetical protein
LGLLSMVEEVLQDPGSEDFVKSFREGSKVTIVRRGGNSSDRFLEVAVYDVGGRREMIVVPEDGRGWGRVSWEVLDFFWKLGGVVFFQWRLGGEEIGQGRGCSVVHRRGALVSCWRTFG